MTGKIGPPSGTRRQIDVYDAIGRAEVHGYPGWRRPQMFWKPNQLDETDVTARARRLLEACLVGWEPAWCDGANRSEKYLLQPTEIGRAWRQQITDRANRTAERAARRKSRTSS